MGTSTISMAMFNSYLYVFQRVVLVCVFKLDMDQWDDAPKKKSEDFWTGGQRAPARELLLHLGLSENVVYPEKPNGFADHYPELSLWKIAISLGIYPIFRQTHVVKQTMVYGTYNYSIHGVYKPTNIPTKWLFHWEY